MCSTWTCQLNLDTLKCHFTSQKSTSNQYSRVVSLFFRVAPNFNVFYDETSSVRSENVWGTKRHNLISSQTRTWGDNKSVTWKQKMRCLSNVCQVRFTTELSFKREFRRGTLSFEAINEKLEKFMEKINNPSCRLGRFTTFVLHEFPFKFWRYVKITF